MRLKPSAKMIAFVTRSAPPSNLPLRLRTGIRMLSAAPPDPKVSEDWIARMVDALALTSHG